MLGNKGPSRAVSCQHVRLHSGHSFLVLKVGSPPGFLCYTTSQILVALLQCPAIVGTSQDPLDKVKLKDDCLATVQKLWFYWF